MKVDAQGNYVLESGKVIPATEVAQLHRTAPLAEGALEKKQTPNKKLQLREGECSGVVPLCD